MKNKRQAFSLIELSIVILIIGILIAGVTQGSRLVSQMKLNTGRSMTQSSPVNSISGLSLWLESTSENSFLVTETDNNANLSQWNDINSQVISKNNLTKTATVDVVYKSSGINGLPAVYFAGNVNVTNSFSGNVISTVGNSFTYFMVYTLEDNSSVTWRALLANGTPASSGWFFQKNNTSNRCSTFTTVVDSCDSGTFSTNPEIVAVTYNGTTAAMYLNGASDAISGATSTVVAPAGTFRLGSTSTGGSAAWKGFVGEVIVFDSALKAADRKEVEKYLGRKWGIKIS